MAKSVYILKEMHVHVYGYMLTIVFDERSYRNERFVKWLYEG